MFFFKFNKWWIRFIGKRFPWAGAGDFSYWQEPEVDIVDVGLLSGVEVPIKPNCSASLGIQAQQTIHATLQIRFYRLQIIRFCFTGTSRIIVASRFLNRLLFIQLNFFFQKFSFNSAVFSSKFQYCRIVWSINIAVFSYIRIPGICQHCHPSALIYLSPDQHAQSPSVYTSFLENFAPLPRRAGL